MSETPTETPQASASGNSAALGVILLVGAWIGGVAFVIYPVAWTSEQFTIAFGGSVSRVVWVVVLVLHAVAVLLPSLIGVAAAKAPRIRAVYRLWSLAGLFALLMIPVHLAPAPSAQAAALLQIIGAAVFLAILTWMHLRNHTRLPQAGGPLWPPLLAAALIGWPWVVWGALGSWLDSALNLIAALLFGLAVAQVLGPFLSPAHEPDSDDRPLPIGLAGFVVGTTILTMGAAFGHNGQQLILLFLLSGMGWLVTAVARGDGAGPYRRTPVALLVSLIVAAPLLFLDPEELLLVLNLGSRDVGYYALYATLLGLVIGLFLGVMAWLLGRRSGEGRRLPAIVATALVCVVLVLVYFVIGQPGWHGDRLYVIMTDQADLSAAAAIADPVERRAAVYQTLTRRAADTQAQIRATLDRAGIDYRPYYLVNALEVDSGPLVRLWLASRPEVDRVLHSPELRPLPEPPPVAQGTAAAPTEPQWNLVDVGAPQVWDEFGARGEGIVIGQSDSGVDGRHPELSEQYRGRRADGATVDEYNWLDPWFGTTTPADRGGHGTHTLGSALGRTVGVAPDAAWIGCVNLGRNLGNAPRYLDCLQFMLAPFPQTGDPLSDGRPELGANVLNNSWGCPAVEGCDPGSLLPAVRALRAAGVFVVASAGNDGSDCSSITAPISLYDEVFTVGAVSEFGAMAPFSSRGPVTIDGSGRIKPDVVAPGVDVLSAYPGGTYEYAGGTSMAGPHVVGVVALLWSADPSLIGDVERTERLLTETAEPLEEEEFGPLCGVTGERPDNAAGYGLVNAYAAVHLALEQTP